MNHDNSSPAVTEQQLPKDDDGGPHQKSSDVAANSSALMEKWGCTLDELYRISVKFFKEKEGKAFHLGYDQKCQLLAYTQQVSHGPYDPAVHGSAVGVLDVVGKDRRVAWQKLADLSRDSARLKFIEELSAACPLLAPCVEAHKKDVEMRADRERSEAENRIIELRNKALQAEEEERRRLELEEREEKRRQIKEALNQQTYTQFKAYAIQQFPDNPDQQAVLIRQLQEQHYVQYMQQIFQQQVNYRAAETDAAFSVSPSTELPLDVEAAALNALAGVHSQTNNQGTLTSLEGGDDVSEGSGNEQEDFGVDIVAASMWTRKDIREFKDSICKEGKDSIIKVGHGETVTVRVPTHEDGSCLFWEFATDSYDIGFGLFFEWSKSPTEQVSVHISDSEEEEDEEEDDENGTEDDVETGPTSQSALVDPSSSRPPLSVIIPVYRRDCQEEVYAGSHAYPGQGVYLLKFDNSYSLWRSKTLYYRVYYTR